MPNHAAAVRAVEAYHATGGESPLEQDITREYEPLVDAAQDVLVCLDAETQGGRVVLDALRAALRKVVGDES